MEEKVEHAKQLIRDAIHTYPRVGVACSFGKDSMVTVHLAREVDPNIQIFAVMTMYKPGETFDYLLKMNERMNLRTTVYMVADSVPVALQNGSLEVRLLPSTEFYQNARQIESQTGLRIYEINPDECCRLLKVEPTRQAVSNLDAWITG